MNRLLNNLEKFWFTTAPPERLALLRITTGGFSLWYLLSRFTMLQKMAKSDSSHFEPIGLLYWMDAPISADFFFIFSIVLVLLNIAFILGWKFRFTGPLFALSLLLFMIYRNSWSMIYHNRNALVLHILVLGFVASSDAFSMDGSNKKGNIEGEHWQYGWPIRLICAATVATYFMAGVAKLASELAFEWAQGSAMRSQIAVDAIRKTMLGSEVPSLFEWLYPHTWLFLILGIATLILELGAPFVLFKKRLGMIWAVLVWGMHWGIFFIMGIRFRYQMSGLIFLSFFDIEKWWQKVFPVKQEHAIQKP